MKECLALHQLAKVAIIILGTPGSRPKELSKQTVGFLMIKPNPSEEYKKSRAHTADNG